MTSSENSEVVSIAVHPTLPALLSCRMEIPHARYKRLSDLKKAVMIGGDRLHMLGPPFPLRLLAQKGA